jgi:hypothetical protein
MQLIVICSWCQKFMYFKKWLGDKPPAFPVSHSICQACKDKLEAELNDSEGGDYESERQACIG